MKNKFGNLSLLFAIIAWVFPFFENWKLVLYWPITTIFIILAIVPALIAFVKKESKIYPIVAIVMAIGPIVFFVLSVFIFLPGRPM